MVEKIKGKKKKKQVNFIVVSIILAVIFWVVEGFIHGLLFNQQFILREIVIPGVHELWMRLVIVTVVIISGVFAHLFLRRYARLSREFDIAEKKYTTLFNKAPVAITIVNTEGTIIECNRSTEFLTGYSREELIGNPYQKLLTLDPKDLPKLEEKFELLARGREIAPYELKITRKNGEQRWINVVSSLLIVDGAVQGFQVIASDLAEIRRPSACTCHQ